MDSKNIDMVILGTDRDLFKDLPNNQQMAAVEVAYEFNEGRVVETVRLTEAADINEKANAVRKYCGNLIAGKRVTGQDILSLYLDSVGYQVVEEIVKNDRVCPKLKDGLVDINHLGTIKSLIEAAKEDPELLQSLTTVAKENEALKSALIEASDKNDKLKRNLITAGIIVAAVGIGVAGKALYDELSNQPSIEKSTEEGYGIYKYDLSRLAGMDEYADLVPDSMQKEGAFNRLAILQEFNNEIILLDETKEIAGLTIEQLIAVDAYSNSNLYTPEDYIKQFGLYDFTTVNNDFQQAVMVTGAYLSDINVDGSSLARIFKDEKVKANYLKQLEYRDLILKAETTKDQEKYVKEYVEYMGSTATDQTREDYIDYDQHPGMAFAASVVINALNYNNISLDSEIISKMIIMGDENQQSKINSICNDADNKIDAVKELKNNLMISLNDNQTIRIYNNGEIDKAKEENREPVLLKIAYEELDDILRNTLCDQTQINELTNKELAKTNQLVTEEGQEKILANAVELSRKLQNEGEPNSLASKLQKPGDTATVTQENVLIDTPQEKQDLAKNAPEQMQAARDKYNQEHGTLPYETPEDKEKTDAKINEDVKNTQQEGVSYYNQVVDYFAARGNVSGVPAELQSAYQNLGANTYNLARNTGISRWTVNNQPTFGGEKIPTVPQDNIAPDNVTNTNTESTVTPTAPTTPRPNPESDTSKVEEPKAEPSVPSTMVPVQENVQTPSNGEVKIDEGFSDVEITDISSAPVTSTASYAPLADTNPTEYSLEDVIGSLSSEQLASLFPAEAATTTENEVSK